jgi:ribonuclease HI
MHPDEAELLRFIAEHEPLDKTRDHFRLQPAELRALLEAAAARAPKVPRKAQAELPLAAPAKRAVGKLERARVYSDGASRGNPGPSGAGAAILDAETGEVVELLKRYLGRQTNNVAEYQAAILGLSRARELGVREVELVADSQLMIRQLGGRYQVKHPGIRPLYEEALLLLKGFAKVRLVHVPREMNQLADEMSNRAIDER